MKQPAERCNVSDEMVGGRPGSQAKRIPNPASERGPSGRLLRCQHSSSGRRSSRLSAGRSVGSRAHGGSRRHLVVRRYRRTMLPLISRKCCFEASVPPDLPGERASASGGAAFCASLHGGRCGQQAGFPDQNFVLEDPFQGRIRGIWRRPRLLRQRLVAYRNIPGRVRERRSDEGHNSLVFFDASGAGHIVPTG